MKIGILGKAASRQEAPFDDMEWTLWGMGRVIPPGKCRTPSGDIVDINRWDAWFDCHDIGIYDTSNPISIGHRKWLHAQIKPIYTLGTCPVPTAQELPHPQLAARFGTYFMRNTVCWAMAYALHLGAEEIGLWGVDQSTDGEYSGERHGVQHFIHIAELLGVPVDMPDACPLLQVPLAYPQGRA